MVPEKALSRLRILGRQGRGGGKSVIFSFLKERVLKEWI